jgi:hypothetical protein
MTMKQQQTSQPSSSGKKSRPKAWSYSQLSAFELCPKKWAAENLYKNVRQTEHPSAAEGKAVHKAFEDYAIKRKPLPLHLRHHQAKVDRLISALPGAEVVAEQRLAINIRREPVDWRSRDTWCRSIIDLMVHTDEVAVVIDWKTGRPKPDYDQLDLMVAMAQVVVPTLKRAAGLFYWTQSKSTDKKRYDSPQEILEVWERFEPRVERFQTAVLRENFPPQRNFLCKAHCPVEGCKYHGMSQ